MFALLLLSCLITTCAGATYTCDRNAQCGCSVTAPTSILSRIIGGEIVKSRTWGWIVSLQYYGSHRCGASLISAEYAITAAHCVDDVLGNTKQLSILAGVNNLTSSTSGTGQRRSIAAIYIHPNYDSTRLTNDIALIHFTALSIGSDSSVSFICLPSSNTDPFVPGTNLIAIGWGVTSVDNPTVSYTLQQVTLQAVASESGYCQRVYVDDPTVQFCAGVAGGGKGKAAVATAEERIFFSLGIIDRYVSG